MKVLDPPVLSFSLSLLTTIFKKRAEVVRVDLACGWRGIHGRVETRAQLHQLLRTIIRRDVCEPSNDQCALQREAHTGVRLEWKPIPDSADRRGESLHAGTEGRASYRIAIVQVRITYTIKPALQLKQEQPRQFKGVGVLHRKALSCLASTFF